MGGVGRRIAYVGRGVPEAAASTGEVTKPDNQWGVRTTFFRLPKESTKSRGMTTGNLGMRPMTWALNALPESISAKE